MTKISQNQTPLFVGVDVSKAIDEAGIAKLQERLQGIDVALVLMEATGGFERPLAQHLCAAGFAVIVANPRQAHDFAKAMGYLAKTDSIDARVLSHFARTLYDSGRREQLLLRLPSAEQQELAALVVRRAQLVQCMVLVRY